MSHEDQLQCLQGVCLHCFIMDHQGYLVKGKYPNRDKLSAKTSELTTTTTVPDKTMDQTTCNSGSSSSCGCCCSSSSKVSCRRKCHGYRSLEQLQQQSCLCPVYCSCFTATSDSCSESEVRCQLPDTCQADTRYTSRLRHSYSDNYYINYLHSILFVSNFCLLLSVFVRHSWTIGLCFYTFIKHPLSSLSLLTNSLTSLPSLNKLFGRSIPITVDTIQYQSTESNNSSSASNQLLKNSSGNSFTSLEYQKNSSCKANIGGGSGNSISRTQYRRTSASNNDQLCFFKVTVVLSAFLVGVCCANSPPRFVVEGGNEIVVNKKEGPSTPVGELPINPFPYGVTGMLHFINRKTS